MDAEPVRRVHQQVADLLRRHRVLGSRRPIVVAVSGGADSLCLLNALVAVVPGASRRLVVGHVDHRLRPGSAADAEHVQAVAGRYGLHCEVITVDVPALAAAERRGVEEAARLGRYRALHGLARESGTDLVVTGHTRDDSVETVLLHLVRGSGSRGLAGIAEIERLSRRALQASPGGKPAALRLVRPLLEVGRAETVGYCQARGILWLTDESNADTRLLRNRVRAHLLPVLRTYNPAVDQALTRLARTTRDEDQWLDTIVRRRWSRLVREVDGRPGIGLSAWRAQPLAIQRRLVRLIAMEAGVEEISFAAVERALAVGEHDGPPRAELGGGLSVKRRAGTLWFEVGGVCDEGT